MGFLSPAVGGFVAFELNACACGVPDGVLEFVEFDDLASGVGTSGAAGRECDLDVGVVVGVARVGGVGAIVGHLGRCV